MKCQKLKPLRWFEIIIAFTLLTLAVTYFVPGDSLFAFLRYGFGFVFVAFLPGYCLIEILFIGRNRLDIVEQVTLSVALSFGLVGLVGLFLGLSPIGINFASITVSLSLLVLIFAAIALARKLRQIKNPTPQESIA